MKSGEMEKCDVLDQSGVPVVRYPSWSSSPWIELSVRPLQSERMRWISSSAVEVGAWWGAQMRGFGGHFDWVAVYWGCVSGRLVRLPLLSEVRKTFIPIRKSCSSALFEYFQHPVQKIRGRSDNVVSACLVAECGSRGRRVRERIYRGASSGSSYSSVRARTKRL